MTTTNDHDTRPVLVLGATGKTGRRVARRLADRGVPVRIGSRSAVPAFDWDDPTTWPAALDGTRAAYITFQPDVSIPGAAEAVGAFASLAVDGGVDRLVLLSGRGEQGALRTEAAVQAAGAPWTVVRASWFAQNFSEDFLVDAVRSGEIAVPAGAVAEPFIDVDDIADIVVAALTDARHAGEVYEVTGPRLLTFADVAGELSAATGRDIRFVDVTADEFVATAEQQGVPGELAAMLAELFTSILDGRNASLADGVPRATGRPARDFADYALAAAATGVWG